MLKRQFKTVAAIAAIMMAGHVFADYTTGTVSGLTARQRRPWNGLVDISFTLTGLEEKYYVAIAATNSATGEAIPVRTLRDKAGNTIGAGTEFVPGAVSLVWDAHADAPGLLVEALALSVVTAPPPPPGVQLWEGGPRWAETNIGAKEPWEFGLYFWWGDTVGYRWEGNAWVASDGSSSYYNLSWKNTPTFGKSQATLQSEGWITADGVLTSAHDAARAHCDEGWRLPTKQEIDDLYSRCDWAWTTTNGVKGYVVRGQGDYYSEASIFLPAAGCGDGYSLYYVGSYGLYWSSVPCSDDNNSWSLHFNTSNHFTSIRCYGFTVRPVLVDGE